MYYIDHLSIIVVVMSYFSSKYCSVYKTKNTTCVQQCIRTIRIILYYSHVYKTLARICALRALYSFRTIILLVCVHFISPVLEITCVDEEIKKKISVLNGLSLITGFVVRPSDCALFACAYLQLCDGSYWIGNYTMVFSIQYQVHKYILDFKL